MIKLKTYEGNPAEADPSIYLGINGSYIPLELFKGVFKTLDIIFTDNTMYGVHFQLIPNKGVIIVGEQPNRYITKDYLENDHWMIINSVLSDSSTQVCGFNTSDVYAIVFDTNEALLNKIRNRYLNGEQGELREYVKTFDDQGDYMVSNYAWNTKPDSPYILHDLDRVSRFIYNDHTVPSHIREFNLYINNSDYIRLLGELKKTISNEFINPFEPELDSGVKKLHDIEIPYIGNITIKIDDSLKNYILAPIY